MSNSNDSRHFEKLLVSSLEEYVEKELDALPPEDELQKQYPIPDGAQKKLLCSYRRISFRRKALKLARTSAVFLICLTAVAAALVIADSALAEETSVITPWKNGIIIDFSLSDGDTENVSTDDVGTDAVTTVPNGTDGVFNLGEVQSEIGGTADTATTDTEKDTDSTEAMKENLITRLELNYFPAEYSDVTVLWASDQSKNIQLTNSNGDHIFVIAGLTSNMGVGVNTEGATHEETVMHGFETHIYYDESDRSGSVVMGDKTYTIHIMGRIQRDELVKVSENLIIIP